MVERAAQRLGVPPAGHPGVVTRAQNLGDVPVPKRRRTGVVRVLQESVGEGLVVAGLLVAHHAGDQAAYRFQDHHGRHLATVENVVADRQLTVHQVLGHPGVDTLVATAQQAEARSRRQLPGQALVEAASPRTQQEQRSGWLGRLDAGEERLGHQHHARAAAEGCVVNRAMGVASLRAEVVCPHVEQPPGSGPAQQTAVGEVLDHLREDREHVDPHRSSVAQVR